MARLWLVLSIGLLWPSAVRAQAADDEDDGSEAAEDDTPSDTDPASGLRYGDDPPFERYDEGGFAYVFGGLLGLDLDKLNAVLGRNGYGTIDEIFVTMGTGAFVTAKRFLLGLETYQTLANEGPSSAPNGSALDGTFWLAHFAYLFNIGPIHLCPILGVGFGTWTLGLVTGRPDFEQTVAERPAHSEIELNSFLIQAAFGVGYLFELSQTPEEVSGILVGLRLGYSLSPVTPTWQLSGIVLDPAPDMHIRAPYICLILGYGNWSASEGGALPGIMD